MAQASPSDLVLRLDRLENQIRQLTGLVEQLQFRNQQLEQQLRAEHGVVFADCGFGAGDDEDRAAGEDVLEIQRIGVAQQRVDQVRVRGGRRAARVVRVAL